MKQITLITLLGLACSSVAMADAAFKHVYENGGHWAALEDAPQATSIASIDQDARPWISSELAWNEEYGSYDVIAALHDDVFQERQVWSDHYGDIVTAGMAFRAVYEATEGKRTYDYKMASGEMVPCMKTAQEAHTVRIAQLD